MQASCKLESISQTQDIYIMIYTVIICVLMHLYPSPFVLLWNVMMGAGGGSGFQSTYLKANNLCHPE